MERMIYIINRVLGTTRRGGSTNSMLDGLMGKCHFFISHLHFSFLRPKGTKRLRRLLITHFSFLLFLSCSGGSDSGTEVPTTPTDGSSVLNIYVYAPGQAVPTRGNTGQVDADPTEEKAIHTLQIWVYTHNKCDANFVEDGAGDHKLVTYFKTNAFQQTPTENDTYKFELPIDDNFASLNSRPKVDVYVLANVTSNNCGLNFDEHTSKSTLEAAVLEGNYFGVSTPVTAVPFEGLPMSGKLSEQTVSGNKPVLTLGTSQNMAKVKLARAVSKARFIFSCSNDFDGLKITRVTFDANMIPTQEYLFLNTPYNPDNNYCNIGNAYNDAVTSSLFSIDETAICADPAHYAWDRLQNDEKSKDPDITPQELAEKYEALINEGLSSNVPATLADDQVTVIDPGHENPRLTERRLYLRESDKQLSGTIYYKVKEKGAAAYGDEQSITFKMVGPADPTQWQPYFSRNHTWIIYAYLAWAKMRIVDVHFKDWVTTEPSEHSLYNW